MAWHNAQKMANPAKPQRRQGRKSQPKSPRRTETLTPCLPKQPRKISIPDALMQGAKPDVDALLAAKLPVTADEVAAVFRMSVQHVYRWIKAGEVPSVRIGMRIAIPFSWFESMVKGERPAASPAPAPTPAGNEASPSA